MNLNYKIAVVYIATLGIAVTGTTLGWILSRHDQQKALETRDTVVQEYILLNRLPLKILYNRPTQELSPYLQDPEGFRKATRTLQERLRDIDTLLSQYQQLDPPTTQPKLRSLLTNYQQTSADFAQRLAVFIATVEPLTTQPTQIKRAEQELIQLVQSPEFVRFIEFPDQLINFNDQIEQQVKRAEAELTQVETSRSRITLTSLLLSLVLASIVAIYLITREQLTFETERQQAQKALEDSYIRLQLALESANINTWDWNPQTNQVSFDQQWKVLLGYPDHEIANTLEAWESHVHPDDLPLTYQAIGKHLQGETPIYENEHRLRCRDGSYKWNFASGKIVERDQQGNPVRFIGIHYDISERKANEIALGELSNQLQKAQEVAHLGYWSFEVSTQTLTASEEVLRIFGLNRDRGTLSFEDYLQSLHPDDRSNFREQIAAALQGVSQNFDHRILRLDGTIRYINCRAELQYRGGEGVRLFGIVMDITERRAAELELEQFFNISLDLLCIADTQGNFRRLNRGWESTLGYTIEALEGKPFLDLVHPDDLASTLEAISNLAGGNMVMKFVNRYRAADGSYRYIEWLSSPQGELIYAAARDITERIQAEATLRASEEKLRLLFELSPLGIILNSMEGQFIEANPTALKITGYSLEELNQLSYFDLTPAEYAADEARQLESLNTIGRYGPYQKEYIHKEGHRCPVELIGVRVKGSNGQQYIWSIVADITERQEAENRLRESEGIWRTLVDVTPAAIAMFDTQMCYLVANPAWYQEYGLEGQDIIGRSHYDLFPYLPPHWKEIHAHCLTGVTQKCEAELWPRAQGNFDWVCWEIRPWIDRHGKIGGLLMYTEIITERKANEIALSELSKQLQKAQEVAHLGYWSFNLATQKITWSEEVFRIFGMSPDHGEPHFSDHIQHYHPDDHAFFLERVQEAQQGIPQNFDIRILRPDGEIRYLNSRIEIESTEAVVVRIFGIIIDITDRKTEETLRSLLSRTQLFNQISTEIRNSLDLDTILQSAVNAIFTELKVDICSFGWHQIDLKSQTWEVVKEQKKPEFSSWIGSYDLDEFPQLFERIFREQFYCLDVRNSEDQEEVAFCQAMGITLYLALPIHTEGKIGAFELGRSHGDQPWQEDEIDLLRNIGNQVAIAIQQAKLYQESQEKSQEIQRAYRELQDTQVQLIQAEKMSSLGQLVAGVAHEINNPVSFIYGNLSHVSDYTQNILLLLELYQESYPHPPEMINDLITEIDLEFLMQDLPKTINSMRTGAERIRDIVKSLRTFSRLDEADLKGVNLHENLDNTLVILQNRLNGRAGKSEIQVIKNYGNLPLIECYIGLLNQVFMNLLVNAIQAIEERQKAEINRNYPGIITITTEIYSSDEISISIRDNGIGMSPEVQAQIFNPFFTTKSVGEGTGMGLSISYQIVTKNHSGELSFNSVLGEGTEFRVKLPFGKSEEI